MRIGRSIEAAITSHEGEADPHPVYDLSNEVDTKITTHEGVASAHHTKTTDASEIISGRFPMARIPDGTSGYVLTAQGLGVDPVYAAAPGVVVVTGTYTGDGTALRQIPTGFKCSHVIIRSLYVPVEWLETIDNPDNASITHYDAGHAVYTNRFYCHPTDGFVVDGTLGNASGVTYYYWAISG